MTDASDSLIAIPKISGFAPRWGLVAILDALGAASYSRDKSEEFLKSRDVVLEAVPYIANESLKRFERSRLKQFVFNDTVVLAYLMDGPSIDALREVETFCHILRAFEMLALARDILFRGSLAIGDLYKVSEPEGTILGPAVSDAAAWYGSSDWIGINATPHASIALEALMEHARNNIDHVLVDYDVPLKDKRTLRLKVINWPKGFFVKGLAPPNAPGATARAKFLDILSRQQVPRDAESKYFNTIAFFDHIVETQKLTRNTTPTEP